MFVINNIVVTQDTNSLFLVRTKHGWGFIQTKLPVTWHGSRIEMLRDNIDNLAEVFYLQSPCWSNVVDAQYSTQDLFFGTIVSNEQFSMAQTQTENYLEVALFPWNKLKSLKSSLPLVYLQENFASVEHLLSTLKDSLLS